MRSLRQSLFGQLFLGAIVVAIILAFMLTGSGSSGGGGDANECAISAGEICVKPKEFLAAYGLTTSIGINEQAAKRLELRKAVALGLVERELLVQQAEKLGIATSEEDVDAELLEGRTRVSLPVADAERTALSLAMCIDQPSGCVPGTIGVRALNVKKDGTFNYELYTRSVRNVTGRSPNHFKEMQQRELTAERLRDLIRGQVKVSDEEAFLAYRRARSEATARIAKAETSWFQRFVVQLDEEALKSFAKDHQEEIDAAKKALEGDWKDGCSVVSELRLEPEDGQEDQDLTKQAQKLAITAKIQKNFEELVRVHSDADSARLGGRIGCLSETYGPGADLVLSSAADLKQAGDISSAVETPRGASVLRLEARLTAENRDAELTSFVTYKLASESAAKTAAEAYSKALIEALKEGTPIADAVTAQNDKSVADGAWSAAAEVAAEAGDRPLSDISRPFSIERNPLPDAAGASPANLVFELEKPDDVVADPVATRGGFAVLQLKSKDITTREQFDEKRTEILAQLRSRKAEEALTRYVKKLVEAAGVVTLNEAFIPSDSEESEPTDS